MSTTFESSHWFDATYAGECVHCDEYFDEGDAIRFDPEGGYQGRECCGD